MANKEFLEDRINSIKSKIEKSNSIINKKSLLILKKQKELESLTDENEIYWKKCDIKWLEGDISEHQRKIEKEYIPSLDKYTKELEQLLSVKRDIPVLVDFLNNWMESAYNFYVEDTYSDHRKELKDNVIKTREVVNTYYKEHYDWLGITDYTTDTYNQYKELSDKYRELQKSYLTEYCYIITLEDKAKIEETSFEEELSKDLKKEWEAKYDKLVNDCEKVIGKILDCSYLYLSQRGELNGTIIGEKGKAKVTTFLAGNYHKEYSWQQCLHFRCKITKIK